MSSRAPSTHTRTGSEHVSAEAVVARLSALGESVAVAESVTGGRIASALTGVAGASEVVRGAVVAYATEVKCSVLGVSPHLLAQRGPVCADVAREMAAGVRLLLGGTLGVASTGEAGPESSSGQPVGTVHLAVSGPRGTRALHVELPGDRSAIQSAATQAALDLLWDALSEPAPASA